jgi:hypothetical protein
MAFGNEAHATKNDRLHGTQTHRNVDEAKIDWRKMRNDTIADFIQDPGDMAETLGEYLHRTRKFYYTK